MSVRENLFLPQETLVPPADIRKGPLRCTCNSGPMKVDQKLVDAAIDQMNRRWPGTSTAVAAAVYLDDGTILTGVSFSNFNSIMTLCAETGPITAAYSTERIIVASVCVSRESDRSEVVVLAPCGACQERLATWGSDLEVGARDRSSESGWASRTLLGLNPYYWAASFSTNGSWPTTAEHSWDVLE